MACFLVCVFPIISSAVLYSLLVLKKSIFGIELRIYETISLIEFPFFELLLSAWWSKNVVKVKKWWRENKGLKINRLDQFLPLWI